MNIIIFVSFILNLCIFSESEKVSKVVFSIDYIERYYTKYAFCKVTTDGHDVVIKEGDSVRIDTSSRYRIENGKTSCFVNHNNNVTKLQLPNYEGDHQDSWYLDVRNVSKNMSGLWTCTLTFKSRGSPVMSSADGYTQVQCAVPVIVGENDRSQVARAVFSIEYKTVNHRRYAFCYLKPGQGVVIKEGDIVRIDTESQERIDQGKTSCFANHNNKITKLPGDVGGYQTGWSLFVRNVSKNMSGLWTCTLTFKSMNSEVLPNADGYTQIQCAVPVIMEENRIQVGRAVFSIEHKTVHHRRYAFCYLKPEQGVVIKEGDSVRIEAESQTRIEQEKTSCFANHNNNITKLPGHVEDYNDSWFLLVQNVSKNMSGLWTCTLTLKSMSSPVLPNADGYTQVQCAVPVIVEENNRTLQIWKGNFRQMFSPNLYMGTDLHGLWQLKELCSVSLRHQNRYEKIHRLANSTPLVAVVTVVDPEAKWFKPSPKASDYAWNRISRYLSNTILRPAVYPMIIETMKRSNKTQDAKFNQMMSSNKQIL